MLGTDYCNAINKKPPVREVFCCIIRLMKYWLLKSEPSSYSIDDLKRDRKTVWDGVRNYQARNSMRDEMRKGDLAFFYHSGSPDPAIVGLCLIAHNAHTDETQFDPKDHHYDPKSTEENPRWVAVDVSFKKKFTKPITLKVLKNDPFFADMLLTQRGSRLSVQSVSEKHFNRIMTLV